MTRSLPKIYSCMVVKNNGPVALRQKTLKDGRTSLYLDIYHEGKRSYEFLKLYLLPGRGKEEREHNNETLKLAAAIRAKRVVEIQNGEYGYASSRYTLLSYFDEVFNSHTSTLTSGSITNWCATRSHLASFGAGQIKLSKVTSGTLNDFIEHVRSAGAGEATLKNHMSRVNMVIRKAIRCGLAKPNALADLSAIKPQSAERMYLTLDEVRRLAATPCKHEGLRRAFLFSCLTGLRKSDVLALRWGDVTEQDGMTRIIFRQKKTRRQEYLDITPNAVAYMGERKGAEDRVFVVEGETSHSDRLAAWVKEAGIEKKITFHCARHTFATLMLSLDVDLYTVSKLLGHSNIGTTQIYAKILDKGKQAAVRKIPKIE